MAKKPVWRICFHCRARFEAPDDWSMNKLIESHRVSNEFGQQCMGKAQMELTFKYDGNAWVKKS